MGAAVPAVMTQPDQVVDLVPCRLCDRRKPRVLFEVGHGVTPPLWIMYLRIRGAGMDKNIPLTKDEVLSAEGCTRCMTQEYDTVCRTQDVLALMQHRQKLLDDALWERSLQKLQEKRERDQKRFQRRDLAQATPKPPQPPKPKKFGDERSPVTAAAPTSKKKNKKRESQKQRGNRQGRR